MRCPAVAGPSDWQARPPDEVQPAPSWLLTRIPEATVLRLASKVALDLPAAPPPLTFEGSAKGSRYCPSYRWANHFRPFDAGQHTRRATSKAATDRAMMTTCIECGEFFPAKRGDACCCSPRCRQAKSRRSERKRSVGNAQEALSTMDRTSARGSPSAALDVTDNRSDHLTLILRPHIEDRNGCRFHSDRFDVYVDGELILTSRQPWHDGARELLRRGYPGNTLLTIRHAGKNCDNSVPLEIGYLAQWSISDSDRGGLKRIRWEPMPEDLKRRGQSRLKSE
jgi:hypothetical protein